MWKLTSLCVLFLFLQVDCWKFFHLGRGNGGNLGKPGGNNFELTNDIPEQWFTQKLDHFNPNNEIIWQQVGVFVFAWKV